MVTFWVDGLIVPCVVPAAEEEDLGALIRYTLSEGVLTQLAGNTYCSWPQFGRLAYHVPHVVVFHLYAFC